MHKKLILSVGHVVAFLSLMFIGYVEFVSITYYVFGNYILSGLVTLITMLIFFLLIMTITRLKGVNEHFHRYIVYERLLVPLMVLCCVAVFIPYAHFWTVKEHEETIVSNFNEAFGTFDDMIAEYDSYSHARIAAVELYADSVIKDRLTAGAIKKGVRLQLRPQWLDGKEREVTDWAAKSRGVVSIWNVFLAGNIDNICGSMRFWEETMREQSSKRLLCEDAEQCRPFDFSDRVESASEALLAMQPIYVTYKFPDYMSVLTGTVAFMLLFVPWLVQKRSPRSPVTFWGKRKFKTGTGLDDQGRGPERVRSGSSLHGQASANNVGRSGQTLDDGVPSSGTRRRGMTLDD